MCKLYFTECVIQKVLKVKEFLKSKQYVWEENTITLSFAGCDLIPKIVKQRKKDGVDEDVFHANL